MESGKSENRAVYKDLMPFAASNPQMREIRRRFGQGNLSGTRGHFLSVTHCGRAGLFHVATEETTGEGERNKGWTTIEKMGKQTHKAARGVRNQANRTKKRLYTSKRYRDDMRSR